MDEDCTARPLLHVIANHFGPYGLWEGTNKFPFLSAQGVFHETR